MKTSTIICLLLILSAILTGCSPGSKMTLAEKRQAIDTMTSETLQQLYTEIPSTKDEVQEAAGYAAFSNANFNIILASFGSGYGVVVDNATGDKTYMKMGSGGIGPGIGAKDYRQVLVFGSTDSLMNFTYSGWKFGAHADAAAKAGDKGGEASGEDIFGDTKVYAITEAGLALQATLTGTKYWKDDELN
ncbi:MAG: YSC84-related protein [Planctomycetota bacterium]